MKIYIVNHSETGNPRKAAEYIASAFAQLIEVRDPASCTRADVFLQDVK